MAEVLEIIFRSFWTFCGTFLLLGLLVKCIVFIIRGYPPEHMKGFYINFKK